MLRRRDAAVEVIGASLSRLREPSSSRKHASAKIGMRSATRECDDLVMIVIIEGTDLVGKSTLAERVAKAHDWPIVKIRWALVGDVKSETFGMANATTELLAATTPDVILDRSYFSMWAYGEEVSYLPELIGRFDQVSRVTPARLVLLTPRRQYCANGSSESEIFITRWRSSSGRTVASRHSCHSCQRACPHCTLTRARRPLRRLRIRSRRFCGNLLT